VIYLRAGLFAEGPSDYQFLCPLLDRLIDTLAAALFAGAYELAPTLGIDAPQGTSGGRAEKIAAAVAEHAELCELFIIHEDGAGDHEEAKRTCIDPGLAAARAAQPGRPLIGVACVPVREIEAWMLADPEPFKTRLGKSVTPALPPDPEREIDPKATLRRILEEGGARRAEKIHALFGERVGIAALRTLPAFRRFETELSDALQKAAAMQGHRP